MCFVKPLKVKKINKNIIILENGVKAFYDNSIGRIKQNDLVLVYGNLVVDRVKYGLIV